MKFYCSFLWHRGIYTASFYHRTRLLTSGVKLLLLQASTTIASHAGVHSGSKMLAEFSRARRARSGASKKFWLEVNRPYVRHFM